VEFHHERTSLTYIGGGGVETVTIGARKQGWNRETSGETQRGNGSSASREGADGVGVGN